MCRTIKAGVDACLDRAEQGLCSSALPHDALSHSASFESDSEHLEPAVSQQEAPSDVTLAFNEWIVHGTASMRLIH